MRRDESKSEALRVLKYWLRRVSHADIEPLEDGRPSPAAARLERTFEALKLALLENRVFLAETDREVHGALGPMLVMLDHRGAVILGIGPSPHGGDYPAALRQRFTWP
jgi:hypothetical protein